MLAFFGLGTQELILVGVFGAAVAVIAFLVIASRATSGGGPPSDGAADRIAALEDENRRLRAELDQARGKRDGSV